MFWRNNRHRNPKAPLRLHDHLAPFPSMTNLHVDWEKAFANTPLALEPHGLSSDVPLHSLRTLFLYMENHHGTRSSTAFPGFPFAEEWSDLLGHLNLPRLSSLTITLELGNCDFPDNERSWGTIQKAFGNIHSQPWTMLRYS